MMIERIYEIVKRLAVEALNDLQEKNNVEAAKGSRIFAWVEERYPVEAELIRKSWGQYLTKASDDPDCKIMRVPGKYLYKIQADVPLEAQNGDALEDVPNDAVEQDGENDVGDNGGAIRVSRERNLYSLLAEWLGSKGYRASDTSLAKKGKVWGNPDISGIKILEGFGSTHHIELATVEAKISCDSWRKNIFEAISHKRFADRCYFAFASPSEEPVVSRIPDFHELREYGEKYRVGILAVFMEPEDFIRLRQDQNLNSFSLSLEDVRIEEVWPAVADPVSPFNREGFIRDVLNVSSLEGLIMFGDSY